MFARYIKTVFANVIRVYVRRNAMRKIAHATGHIRNQLRNMGFEWDKSNRTYELMNPSIETISRVAVMMPIEIVDYGTRKV